MSALGGPSLVICGVGSIEALKRQSVVNARSHDRSQPVRSQK